jgi:TRAP-type mannitol/chloroaromatic compound transport system permease small subunit
MSMRDRESDEPGSQRGEPEERFSPETLLIIGGALWMVQGLAGIVKVTSYLENANHWITASADPRSSAGCSAWRRS